MILFARQQRVLFPRRPLVMGIVNLNDDSFCGDGTLDPGAALAQAR
jgi:dihydropteroate synthase